MSGHREPEDPEIGFQPGSHGRVLRNRPGITRKREMDRAEWEALLQAQETVFARFTPETALTAELLCELHREWLGALYDWAGRYRHVELAKDDYRWLPPELVPEEMLRLEETVLAEHTPCPAGGWQEVARHLAAVHAEVLRIHPFREGNGRLARWLAGMMALQAGCLPPTYGFTGPGAVQHREAYLEAVRRGYEHHYEELERFFAEALARQNEESGSGLATDHWPLTTGEDT